MAPLRALALVALIAGGSLASLVAQTSTAHAQETVVLLGLTSLEGDDEYARNLTGALRHAATAVSGWSVSERDVALSQMELVHGCESSDPACMALIAGTLGAQRLVYGTVSRSPMGSGYEFAISVFSFNVASGEVDQRDQRNLSSARTDIDDLRDPAREMIAAIAHVTRIGAIRAAGSPGEQVRIDGTVVGTLDAGGTFVASGVTAGPHEVVIGSAAPETVTVGAGTEQLVGRVPAPSGGGGGPSINWLAVSMLAVAAVGLVGTIYSWGRLLALSNDTEYNDYRTTLGTNSVSGDVACAESSFSNMAVSPPMATHARGVCSEGATLEILQYVFLGVTVAAGTTGIVLLVLDSSNGETPPSTVSLLPSFGPNGGSMQLRMSF